MVTTIRRFSAAALVLLALAAGCSIAPVVPVQATNRNVLAEAVFADTSWGYCALAVRALDSLSKARYDTAVPVVAFFPVGRFGVRPDDSLHLAPYGVQPKTLVLDGTTKIPIPDDVGQYGPVFSGYIDVQKSESAFVSLGLVSASADTATGRLVVWAAVDSAPAGADLRLLAIVTQDSFMTGGSFPMRFDHVAQRILPDHYGVALPLARGDTLVDTFDFSTAGLLPAYLRAAVFVEDAVDHTIAQALNVPGFVPLIRAD